MSTASVVRRGRGRPAVYTTNVREYIVALIRKHNASGAREILNANRKTKLAGLRDSSIVSRPLGISMPTLLKIASNAGIELHRGRPAA